jgi:hypothetical protein
MEAPSVLCVVTALVLTGCGARGHADSTHATRGDARTYVLTPRDLGRGYRVGDDSGCGQFSPEETSEEFTTFVLDTKPTGCTLEINYIWGGPRATVVPRGVTSAVAVFRDESDARRGMELRKELIDFMVPASSRNFVELPDFGHDAVSFDDGGYDVPPGAGVFWRDGKLLAAVFATGGVTAEDAPRVALKLARMQQERIEHPKPPPPASDDDEELPLDDPQLDAPVYWLGREFKPGGGLPSLHFSDAHTYGGSGGEPTFTAELDYGNEDARKTYGVKILVFTPQAFKGFEQSVLGRLVRDTPCSEATEIKLSNGRAIIWGGFAKPTKPPCPHQPYDRYFAHVFLRGAVVTVNAPFCLYPCLEISGGTADPYNTPRGLEAIARSLRVRIVASR